MLNLWTREANAGNQAWQCTCLLPGTGFEDTKDPRLWGLEEKLSTDAIFQGQGTSKQAKKRHCWTWNLSYIQKPQNIGDAGNLEHLPKPAADANWANLSLWDKLSVQTGTREVKYPNLFGTQIILSELQMPDIKLYY